jgi:hypothetical protein
MFPVSVARLRICTDPTVFAASTSAGNQVLMAGWAVMSVSGVVAPIRARPALASSPRKGLLLSL